MHELEKKNVKDHIFAYITDSQDYQKSLQDTKNIIKF